MLHREVVPHRLDRGVLADPAKDLIVSTDLNDGNIGSDPGTIQGDTDVLLRSCLGHATSTCPSEGVRPCGAGSKRRDDQAGNDARGRQDGTMGRAGG